MQVIRISSNGSANGYCPNCGYKPRLGDIYCAMCGARLETGEAEQ